MNRMKIILRCILAMCKAKRDFQQTFSIFKTKERILNIISEKGFQLLLFSVTVYGLIPESCPK